MIPILLALAIDTTIVCPPALGDTVYHQHYDGQVLEIVLPYRYTGYTVSYGHSTTVCINCPYDRYDQPVTVPGPWLPFRVSLDWTCGEWDLNADGRVSLPDAAVFGWRYSRGQYTLSEFCEFADCYLGGE